ncbi:uncharacterized protein E5676_scaffold325G00300 [Cucumis melo var. makuwa]|uniref:Uncharacterized protein n=1 Tax=Cucumis melo var. makuwa TaxID=1194695 RepID=A0A5A7TTH2_CUCMM|nr:uncharacterized protein E6C27_scaffold30G001980 [Cucumis melo var. makuwa]TYK27354.1 uncharacterized protein E5676_scaffold325G00300 [Cucumis melo var. makuwa]
MRAIVNQAPVGGAIFVNKVKILELKLFCGARDANALENFIFDLEQYFKTTNTVIEEAKMTLTTMHLSEDAKLWKNSARNSSPRMWKSWLGENCKAKVFCFVEGLKPWAKTKLYEQWVEELTSAYAATERLFDLTSDSKDVRCHQSSSPGRNRNSCPSSPELSGETNVLASLIPDSDDKSDQAEGEVDQIEGGEKLRIGALKYLSLSRKRQGREAYQRKGVLIAILTLRSTKNRLRALWLILVQLTEA